MRTHVYTTDFPVPLTEGGLYMTCHSCGDYGWWPFVLDKREPPPATSSCQKCGRVEKVSSVCGNAK